MTTRRKLGPLLVALPLVTIGAAGVAHGIAVSVRYASPTGHSTATCSASDPCDIVTAVNKAPEGSTVVVDPGTYPNISTGLVLNGTNITVRGAAVGSGTSMPRLETDASNGIYLTGTSTVENLEVDAADNPSADSPAQAAIVGFPGTTISHVIVKASGAQETACFADGTLVDSLCLATGNGGVGVFSGTAVGDSTIAVTVSGVTAEATGAAGEGIEALGGNDTNLAMSATNVISHGGAHDVVAANSSTGGAEAVNIDLRSSDYVTTDLPANAGVATITHHASDITATPKFRDAAHGDYREKSSSPTVNAGAAEPAAATDLAGNARTLGTAPDIGAYELLEPPSLGHLASAKISAHTAKLTVPVNPEGLSTTVRFVATHGKATVTSKGSAGAGTATRPVTITLQGLRPHKRYTIVVTATNSAATVTSNALRVTTP
jgi:hypothetical protein